MCAALIGSTMWGKGPWRAEAVRQHTRKPTPHRAYPKSPGCTIYQHLYGWNANTTANRGHMQLPTRECDSEDIPPDAERLIAFLAIICTLLHVELVVDGLVVVTKELTLVD